ncbi:bifunctional 4-hydroxy-2-oxoglutarate aldolase/2-dehydro-3-deoxy-phosphogluconate aldolase [Chondrinema litorale]|uniref:bifunctional 4-hydroxy-2-oxoglutarate aldolase/2-dehydro-3-deoxy-phosphogluconate aldolase n=1 Tax=Chondrinema litorale TaxID=2994555 RepID=UPI0025437D4B|nr:bifunctional 4-hydroxy-2-oxoglutarate aldolase/2-dehydro-3-deoxy-phosphogluconate aldolase [Chondrinema litorale]UZR96406.1 bifunctional 4-hydroxy-2-oxoglutarate aldolase/2-dehydro-3-deoxy-phosphogluconate aldolase [Chondrinema litorale]
MANNTTFSWDLYHKAPVIGIIRGLPKETIYKLTSAFVEAGFYTIEITMNTPDAEEIISTLIEKFPQMNIGAGTVISIKDLENAKRAGANFIVTPVISEEVIAKCVSYGIPIFPGAYSPTEIFKAWTMGAAAVKVFPAAQLGVQYIKDVLAPLNEVKLLPTGGVSLQNIKTFFEVGAFGVGMGSSLFDKKMIQEEDYNALKDHFVKLKQEINVFIKS